ncbi:hypothetical protein GCM10009825_30280 [Arthrobacter humicola]|uniref:Secreted protein n=1 Tax=Arthrobacter humicola TaxID=409291 RepID=A0ABN2ZGD7_9MICC
MSSGCSATHGSVAWVTAACCVLAIAAEADAGFSPARPIVAWPCCGAAAASAVAAADDGAAAAVEACAVA